MKFKKIISLLTTMMVAAAPICSTSYVNATSDSSSTYLVGDINDDDSVNITDVSYMMQFLKGSVSANARTAKRLDINQDNVIDSRDMDALFEIIDSGETSHLTYPSSLPSLPNQKNDLLTGINYNIYRAGSGAYVSSYKLDPVEELTSYTPSSRGIIGTDDREREPGLGGVINVQSSSGENFGTAFAVDSHTLLTAAHVIYQKNYSSIGIPSNLKFVVFGVDNEPLMELHARYYHIPNYYVQNAYVGIPATENRSNPDAWPYDYAIVKVYEDISTLVNFNLGVVNSDFSSSDLRVTGFGATDPNIYINENNVNVKTTGSGSICTDYNNGNPNQLIQYNTDTVGGDSGAPVYIVNQIETEEENTHPIEIKTAIAIHHVHFYRTNPITNTFLYYTVNQGVKINTDILHFVYNNEHL